MSAINELVSIYRQKYRPQVQELSVCFGLTFNFCLRLFAMFDISINCGLYFQMWQDQFSYTSNSVLLETRSCSGVMDQSSKTCAGCSKRITESFLLSALDEFWHIECLRCSCCGVALGDVGTSCFTKGGMTLCRSDYIRYELWYRFWFIKPFWGRATLNQP